jgi:hypothetical protein
MNFVENASQVDHAVVLSPIPPTVSLKINGQHPNPPVVTVPGPMTLTLDMGASAYTGSLLVLGAHRQRAGTLGDGDRFQAVARTPRRGATVRIVRGAAAEQRVAAAGDDYRVGIRPRRWVEFGHSGRSHCRGEAVAVDATQVPSRS